MKFEDRIESLTWKALLGSFNLGLRSAYKSENYIKYIWVTPKSEKNCETCKAMDGVELNINEAAELFPLHPSCVCFLSPKV